MRMKQLYLKLCSVLIAVLCATTVEALITDPHATIQAIYTPDGRKHATLQRGINIVRWSDGTTRKIRY